MEYTKWLTRAAVLLLSADLALNLAFQSSQHRRHRRSWSTTALDAVTPVGTFCPFRSKAANEMEVPMQDLTTEGPAFALAFARINLDLQMGNQPNKEQLMTAAERLQKTVSKWEAMTTKMRQSPDFQTREYVKLTEAHLANYDESLDGLVAGLKWQSGCLRAMAEGKMPPMPPPSVDISKMMAAAQNRTATPFMAALSNAERIVSKPFTGKEAVFESSVVKEEFEKLCRDHSNLIAFGASYGQFDPLGKLHFLDEIEKIEQRWDIFFARFSLMNAIDKAYVKQCNAFLKTMNMNESDYRKLLKQCHDLMRQEAEMERNKFGV